MKIDDRNKKFMIYTATAGSFGVLYGGLRSVSKSVSKLEKEFMKNVKPEYFSYLNSDELQSVQKLLNKGLSEKELNMFSRIWKIPDKKQFAKEAMDISLNGTGYEHLKPELTFETTRDFSGGWRWTDFNINISDIDDVSKVKILSTLKHEIEHFKQFVTMLRTEGIGVDKIFEMEEEFMFNTAKKGKSFEGKTDEEIKNIISGYLAQLKALFSVRQELAEFLWGKIPADSPEGIKSKAYFDATKNYVKIDRFSGFDEIKQYEENLLEKEAFAAGDACADKYGDFILALAEDKKSKPH